MARSFSVPPPNENHPEFIRGQEDLRRERRIQAENASPPPQFTRKQEDAFWKYAALAGVGWVAYKIDQFIRENADTIITVAEKGAVTGEVWAVVKTGRWNWLQRGVPVAQGSRHSDSGDALPAYPQEHSPSTDSRTRGIGRQEIGIGLGRSTRPRAIREGSDDPSFKRHRSRKRVRGRARRRRFERELDTSLPALTCARMCQFSKKLGTAWARPPSRCALRRP
jgi:hypothetical protein